MSGEIFIPRKEKEHLLSETAYTGTGVLKRQSEFSLQQSEPQNRKLKGGVEDGQEATYYEPGGKRGTINLCSGCSHPGDQHNVICPIPLGMEWGGGGVQNWSKKSQRSL